MSVIIRRARLSDFKTVSRLNGQSVDTTYSFYNPQIQELMRKRNSGWRLLKARLDGLREVLVAVDDGLTVGFLIGSANSDGVAFVYSLYVDASQRGKKTGERLLEYFESKVVAESVAFWRERLRIVEHLRIAIRGRVHDHDP